jgi:predicted GTPase
MLVFIAEGKPSHRLHLTDLPEVCALQEVFVLKVQKLNIRVLLERMENQKEQVHQTIAYHVIQDITAQETQTQRPQENVQRAIIATVHQVRLSNSTPYLDIMQSKDLHTWSNVLLELTNHPTERMDV